MSANTPSEVGGLFICRPAPLVLPSSKDEQMGIGLTLLSDLHLGARCCRLDRILLDLNEAQEYGDRLCFNGDLFDGILTRDWKRYSPHNLDPRLAGVTDIVNKSLDIAFELLAPYVNQIDMIGCGNHESALEKHHNVDISLLLIDRLNLARDKNLTPIHYGGYTGFLQYRILDKPGASRAKHTYNIFYHHGWGSGASLSSSASDLGRAQQIVEDVDLIWLGHKHTRMVTDHVRIRCPGNGLEPIVKCIRFVRTGAYLDTYRGQSQASARRDGRRSNYGADAAHIPNGQGGARVILSRGVSAKELRVRVLQ